MTDTTAQKYRPFAPIALSERRWPSQVLAKAPVWCSVDLRDGNQALIEPMGIERKLALWDALVNMGFREIEVGFPAASQPDFDFVRKLIDEGRIPEGVTIQVLTQARADLIDRTFEAIRGARRVIVHLYNSTSEVQRRVVFNEQRPGIIAIAVRGAERIVQRARELEASVPGSEVALEYSPESFTGTELDFAKEIVEAVAAVWKPHAGRKLIVNLPATVEMATPNVYADQIEWMHRNLQGREHLVLSVHPHNDRGTAVAAAELAMLAGADRVEGTLFGNGERTGNVCVVTLALNLFTQGIEPGLSVGAIDELKQLVEEVNRLPVHPRHPYAGELVYTAFSGSHQDAIQKGLKAREQSGAPHWEVPYLPIDPSDVGRSYEAVIRVNSQSGKSGVQYVLRDASGFDVPKELAVELSKLVQAAAEKREGEVPPSEVVALFKSAFVDVRGPIEVRGYRSHSEGDAERHAVSVTVDGAREELMSAGSGPIDAFAQALSARFGVAIDVSAYTQHALTRGASGQAVAYVRISVGEGGPQVFGVGVHESTVVASLRAMACALNRAGVVRAVAASAE
jgi:2-isopropylmalate synthase